jgi:hypothetical protein
MLGMLRVLDLAPRLDDLLWIKPLHSSSDVVNLGFEEIAQVTTERASLTGLGKDVDVPVDSLLFPVNCSVTYSVDGTSGPKARSVSALLTLKVKGKDTLATIFGERDPSSLWHAGAGKMLGDVWAYDSLGKSWIQVEAKGDVPPPRG